MTHEEHLEYDKLTLEEKERDNKVSKEHPNWSHKQLILYLKLVEHDLPCDELGGDVPPIKTAILEKIKRFFS